MTGEEARTTVLIADDHPVVRSGVRALVEREKDLEVVGEAADSAEALRKTKGHKPDVVVLDLSMGEATSVDVIPELRVASPDTRIVILTVTSDPVAARSTLRGGASGFVLKEAVTKTLVEVIRMVAAGRTYVDPRVGARLAREPERMGSPGGLSEREGEILGLVALGHTNTEIAEKLWLSVRTVESHRAHIQQKLGLLRRAELVRYALDHDLVS